MASDVAVKVEVATPCAIALNLVISNLSATSEKAVMEALKETETSMRIVGNRKDFAEGAKKIEYFEETTFLLSTIMWRWPPSGFPVGNDVILMKVLANIHTRTDKATLFSKLFLLQFHSIPHKSLCILDFTRTYPLCKNPFFTFLASKSRLKLTNARKGARCRDFSRKTWPTFLGVPLITMHMEGYFFPCYLFLHVSFTIFGKKCIRFLIIQI
ncbi:BTB/POZ domain-containing protein [Glycine soja]|uniref:BTB/POZ domain-containing protein n=1 Tax=Glycine soja TaxID=3848 RepID=A0A445HBK1_GLYSO|nr:BTB/POZ domain-containing protein [Glycine soja]